MYKLAAEAFQLELEPRVFEEDIEYPVNTTLGVNVKSYGFAAETTMDIDIKKFAVFAKELTGLYRTLTGKARLEEPYGLHNYIEFEAVTGGHIKVKGKLYDEGGCGHAQELSFENEFDQTCLQNFAAELLTECKRYLENKMGE